MFGKRYSLAAALGSILLILSIGGCENSMARGYPDWGINTGAFGQFETDINEIPARLGSPYSFLRSGKVIFADKMDTNISQWIAESSASGGAITRDTTFSFFGSGSLKIVPSTNGNGYHAATRFVPLIESGNVGLTLLLWSTSDKHLIWIDFYTIPDDGGRAQRIQIDVENKTISYRHSSGSYITVFEPNTLYSEDAPTWMLIKLVVNVENNEYVRLHFNDQVADISGIQGPVAASIWPSIVQISIRAFDTSGSKAPLYVDGVVLTIDEP
ncbi:hypothetical protein LCGC14_1299700 [marine sediment metagenome]|uniref:Uncharacterized protein n=1 Tax=marine sediment metagenome TaxID=412755 RepID=A0A0F9NSX2_9ZZZZ